MTRIPDAVAFASLDTHRLIVTVPNEGPADVACNLPRPVAADILRQLANSLESPAGACDTAYATGAPCPLHDAPVPRPAGLDALLAAVADQLPADDPDLAALGLAAMAEPEAQQPATDWVADVRSALAFNAEASHPVVITLRDVLLDDARRSPEQALAAALVLLAAHTRELSALAQRDTDEYRDEHGVNRGTRGLLTGMQHTRRLLDRHATGLEAQVTE
ncbi:hypothetical protein SEA_RALEIGH_45 [Streptomyces phage Raleigh]|uniref:LigA protein n=1 Tax=Streptomyces phage Raleigh TaxID=1920312 RepID=A0A1J0MCK9_9CAUD|nr:hypothetical protein [Streptomyces sp. MMBL 11-1]YP_009788304.1 hypothetical protein HOR46_gp45 [Streptomyces phage Raleigh]APD18793.1 hypothetical protein SEA_RALEIGH_45 [Streptomyces phage Raleigh]